MSATQLKDAGPVLWDCADPVALELDPGSRSFRLRGMYWRRTHEVALSREKVTGSGKDTLTGHAEDFAAVLDASSPFIQPDEVIVGCCLTEPQGEIDLGYYNSHYPPGHENILRQGLAGISDRASSRLLTETEPAKRDFLKAVEISYDAACRYVLKYAECAREMAEAETDPVRSVELGRIASVCRELAASAPSSFQAALQLFQFTRLFGGRGCIGRFDQWMYPYLLNDVEDGKISREEAQELLECAFVKLNYFGGSGQAPNDSLRNITLAGQTRLGEDACNELSYMCLEASGKLMLPEPKLNVRFFPGSPPKLLRACCRVLAKGANVLAIFNDDVVIPALSRLGIPLEDIRDYCNDGCSELLIGGRSTLRFQVHDALPLLTETVLDAKEQAYLTFGDVLAAFKSRLTRFMPEDHGRPDPVTSPYFAASIDDCLEEASPAGARYSLQGSILAQVGNVSDGLAAIKKLIFEDEMLTWEELITAVKANFEDFEPLRQMVLNRAPKYGNDDDDVDEIARDITETFCDGVHRRARNPAGRGSKRAAGLMCFGMHRKKDLPASPDGRREGDLTASSFSPSVGMDRSGPTAVLKSVAKVDLTKASHGSVLDMALHTAMVDGEEAFEKFVVLVGSFLSMQCTATLQLNVIDRDTLLRARANPDSAEFKTLIVRVWGFSAVFVELSDALQDHVLSRTEHGHPGG